MTNPTTPEQDEIISLRHALNAATAQVIELQNELSSINRSVRGWLDEARAPLLKEIELLRAGPSGDAIARFLMVFARLEGFEAQSRAIRGFGAFTEDECPDQSVVDIVAWLKGKVDA